MIATRPALLGRPTGLKGDFSVTTHTFEARRVDISSAKPFPFTLAALEKRVPPADLPELTRLASSRAGPQGIEDAVQVMVGDSGFIRLAKVDQRPLGSLLGKPQRMAVYLIANPVLANRMCERNPAVGVYAPLRVSIYEADGRTHFTYDQPSGLLNQFDDEEIRAIGSILDAKVNALADYVLR
jgi:uncharacterized protein (DUF302 family)